MEADHRAAADRSTPSCEAGVTAMVDPTRSLADRLLGVAYDMLKSGSAFNPHWRLKDPLDKRLGVLPWPDAFPRQQYTIYIAQKTVGRQREG
jgi:hypothetical protein